MAGVVKRNSAQPESSRCGAFYNDLRFVAGERGSELLAFEEGPKAVGRAAPAGRVATRGEHIAAIVVFETPVEGAVAVTRTSDWQVRQISAHEGQAIYPYALAVDDRYVYVAETPGVIGYSRALAAVYRYELSQLWSPADDSGPPL